MDHADYVIAGAGVMGASVAYHLAARGARDILMLEAGPEPVGGSTGRSAAGVRHQFSSPVNVELSLYSIAALERFADEVGADAGLELVGYLLLLDTPADVEHYTANLAMQRRLGAPVELLAPDEAARLVPGLRTDNVLAATFGPRDGYCDARKVALGYLNAARRLGARVRCLSPVVGVTVESARVRDVQTPGGRIACGAFVNAAGPWAGALAGLAGLELPVAPVCRSVFVTRPFEPPPSRIPLTIDVGSGFWIRRRGDHLIFGLARPDQPPGERIAVDWEWLPQVLAAGRRRLPVLGAALLDRPACWAGLYEVSPDSNPILGRRPELHNWYDISGFSGHGIMHSPAAGLLLAEEILDGRAHSIAIEQLRIARFSGTAAREQAVF